MTDARSDSDLDLEIRVVVEYGYALAAAAERCLRYPELMQRARSDSERDELRAAHRGFLRRTIGATTIINAILDANGDLPDEVDK